MVHLSIEYNMVTNADALSGMTSLETLVLDSNQITDIAGLSQLVDLRYLSIKTNQVSNINALSELTALTELLMESNQVSDLMPLSDLGNLFRLNLRNNDVIDITPLAGLTALIDLRLLGNDIVDITPLSTLTSLRQLELGANQITDIDALSPLTDLNDLNLSGNEIADLGALEGLTSLGILRLGVNRISNIDALVANQGVAAGDTVYLSQNPLSQSALCADIPALETRGVTVTYTGTCGGDTDGDGLADAYETYIGTKVDDADSDDDGLTDGEEVTVHFTDPLVVDTDGDGYDDGEEVAAGSDPLNNQDSPTAPVAAFAADVTSGVAPLTVQFTDLSTNSPTEWSWTFGDGGSSAAQNPTHQYATPGAYTVSLTAINAYGVDMETKTDYITVTAAGPVANFVAIPTSGREPLTVQFMDASSGDPTSWWWDFDDNGVTDSTDQDPSHTYPQAGTYTVTLTVANDLGSDIKKKTDYITVYEDDRLVARLLLSVITPAIKLGESIDVFGVFASIPPSPPEALAGKEIHLQYRQGEETVDRYVLVDAAQGFTDTYAPPQAGTWE
ncbi:MAG TPA: PKD domain-containing protein, partial [Candidatus Hydrogenedentes bacterium]|nr:PKD domain-containing protein [Candidatus Hydrogenedentota bacterium]